MTMISQGFLMQPVKQSYMVIECIYCQILMAYEQRILFSREKGSIECMT